MPPVELQTIDLGSKRFRRELRFKPTVGARSTFNVSGAITTSVTPGGEAIATTTRIPEVTMTFESVVDSVSERGEVQCTMTLVGAKVVQAKGTAQSVVDASNAGVQKFVGMRLVSVSTDRGIVKSIVSEHPEADAVTKGFADELATSMSQYVIPLPDEAVGKGAIWKTKFKSNMAGCTTDAVATYTVEKIAETTALIKVEVSQSAKDQDFNLPGQLPGLTKIRSLSISTAGSMAWARDQWIGTKIRLNTTVDISMETPATTTDGSVTIVGDQRPMKVKSVSDARVDLVTPKPESGSPSGQK
jgi:hypothetical protein